MTRTCKKRGCTNHPRSKYSDLCNTHYRLKREAEETRLCKRKGCEQKIRSSGLCSVHYWRQYEGRGTPRTPMQRFMDLVQKGRGRSPCWVWQGSSRMGYPAFAVTHRSSPYAHRWYWEQVVGPVPKGMQLDHLCRNKMCVNPKHLEAVTPKVNRQRAAVFITECPHGHPYTEENTRRRNGKRECRTCARLRDRRRREKERNGKRR